MIVYDVQSINFKHVPFINKIELVNDMSFFAYRQRPDTDIQIDPELENVVKSIDLPFSIFWYVSDIQIDHYINTHKYAQNFPGAILKLPEA